MARIAVTGALSTFFTLPGARQGRSRAFASALRTNVMRNGFELAAVGPQRNVSYRRTSVASSTGVAR
jgi:hypothetical protein